MKNNKIRVVLIILCLIVLLGLLMFLLTHKIKENNENKANTEKNNPTFYNETQNLIANNESKIDDEIKDENVSEYWEEYTNPVHWSEKTNQYTLAYILDPDKNTCDNLKEKSDTIIKEQLPSTKKGVFIAKDSRTQLEHFLKNNVDENYYISDDGFLEYREDKESLKVESDLVKLLNKLIFNSDKLTILSIAYSYYDENNVIDDAATEIPIELNCLQFNPQNNIQLMIYSQYNFSIESFIEGIEKLTGETIQTK